MTEDEDDQAVLRLAHAGLQVPASVLGAVIGALSGDPAGAVVGALTGTVFASVAGEIATRMLSHKEEERIGQLLISAAAAITVKQVMGRTIRDDGFFDGDRSSGAEFTEGVLLAARDTFEQRKIPYMGNLLANVSFTSNVNGAAANLALKLAENMSWTEMCVMGVFRNPEKYPMPDHKVGDATDWDNWAVLRALGRVNDGSPTALLMQPFGILDDSWEIPRHNLDLSAIKQTSAGDLLGGMMELENIPADDLRPIYQTIIDAKPREPAPDA